MTEPSPSQLETPDELPRSAIADQPLSLTARSPGPRGLAGKIGLAVLALLILFAMVVSSWVASHYSRKGALEREPSQITQP